MIIGRKASRLTPKRPKMVPGAKKRKKRGEIPILKEKLWALTRQLVFKTYGTDCYTCEHKDLQGSNCQGGHMPWHSSELSITCRYDIRYIRAQCFNCNMRKGGKGGTANQRMRAEGIDVDALWAYNESTKGIPQSAQFLIDLTEEYKKRLESIAEVNE